MRGFLGAFSVNSETPDYWGIGKSVPRGVWDGEKDRQTNDQMTDKR